MAQAMVEKDIKKTFPLSDVLHVVVTKTESSPIYKQTS